VTLLLERTVVEVPELRDVVVVLLPVLRLVRLFWSTVPAEREVVEPEVVLRLVVAEVELPLERLVVPLWVPVLRLVRLF